MTYTGRKACICLPKLKGHRMVDAPLVIVTANDIKHCIVFLY